MNCPVCDRSLAPTLSICPSCGAMMYDTVREELQAKIGPATGPRTEMSVRTQAAPPVVKRTETAGLVAPKTSPTLVDFHNKNAPLPDWRIQLQNAVKHRKGAEPLPEGTPLAVTAPAAARPSPAPALEPVIDDPRVASAMRRI